MANKIDIDFFVGSNPYFLKVTDLSQWGLIDQLPSIIEITLPGYESYSTFYFDKSKVNAYNSNLLGFNCGDGCEEPDKVTLPDGVYKITVKGSPDTYFKTYYYLKTDLFDMEVAKIYIDNLNKRYNENLIKELRQVEFLMKSAKACLLFDDITGASQRFDKAQEMIDDLKNCAGCN